MIFRRGYAVAALIVLAIEVIIALFVRDAFVRPYLGDTLAVILVYCAVRAVLPLTTLPAALIALAIAFAIETGQYFGLLYRLGLGDSQIARVVIGTGFEPHDFIAYTAGALVVLAYEYRNNFRSGS